MSALSRIIRELLTPGTGDPYTRGVIGIAHAMLGAALGSAFGAAGIAAAFAIGAAYWFAKERRDLKRGGAWLDGLEDAGFVTLGAFYPGPWWWPALVLLTGLAVMVIAEARR